MQEITPKLEQIALKVVALEAGDVPAMGELLNALDELSKKIDGFASPLPGMIVQGLHGYVERLILNEESDLELLGESVGALQDVWREVQSDANYMGDYLDLLRRLDGGEIVEEVPDESQTVGTWKTKPETEEGVLSDEDAMIMRDFSMEAIENLEKIELSLMDLAQNPDSTDIINDIFRPFHTIKGVSGFLTLNRINRLSHCTENLLDSARKGDFTLGEEHTDIILEAVDMLKEMIYHIQSALISQDRNLEGDTIIEPMIAKIEGALTGAIAPAKPLRLGEILVESGYLSPEDLKKGLEIQKQRPSEKIGKILVDEKLVQPRQVTAALNSQKKAPKAADLQVKVDTIKLDSLIDLTGELVISQSMLKQNEVIRSANDPRLYQNINHLSKIVSDLQKTAMFMRMIPIKNTFQKMVRLVRDLARSSGKKVDLEMNGEDTEIDRNVVEELYEPLVHMVRNAVDHGLEIPGERLSAGKPEHGRVGLRAYHKGSNIMIEIQDDGRGLNKSRILEKAVAGGLASSAVALSDEQIFDFIFHPGFSTASQVTDVSGRGVGMDVVRKRIEKLKGQVSIRSEPGKGAVFTIALPLTLAIIEGMVVRVGNERYILPTLAIVETVRPQRANCFTVAGKGEMIKFRGELIPLARLTHLFGVEGQFQDPWDGLVVAVEHKGRKLGLFLDELLGKEEVVIKSLGETFRQVKGISGGAILGDGRIGLILDMEGVFELGATQKESGKGMI